MVWQRHEADCGAAVLAMLLHISYEDALLALGGEEPDILRGGVWMATVRKAAKRLGVTMRLKSRWDPDDDEGIVQILLPGRFNHFVLLRGGLFFNTNGTVWDPEDYYRSRKAKPGKLLVRED